MTREEAKEVFINRGYVNVKGGTFFDGDKWRQSVEVITEWLKEEPCEDAINRQAVLEKAYKMAGYDRNAYVVDVADIEALPSVTCSRKLTLEELESVISVEISKDFKYDTETDEFFVYRHKYTGKEIHIQKEPKTFVPSVTCSEKPNRCKDCKYFEYDSFAKVDGIPLIVAHEICNRWGDGCKSNENGYCFLFEAKMGG